MSLSVPGERRDPSRIHHPRSFRSRCRAGGLTRTQTDRQTDTQTRPPGARRSAEAKRWGLCCARGGLQIARRPLQSLWTLLSPSQRPSSAALTVQTI